MSPAFTTIPAPEVGKELLRLLPEQGSFELQRDQSGKTHDWHFHSLDEELFILSGQVLLFWVTGRNECHEKYCVPGTWITLPAGTRHGSVAGHEGAVYMIRPKDGQTAQTTFLRPGECEHPAPSFARAGA